MNLAFLGDALDHLKGSLLEFLVAEGLLRDLAVDPMATDVADWTRDDFALFARLLRVKESQVLRHKSYLATRSSYFAEITHRGDIFLDPDTGIYTGGSPVDKYVKPRELVRLLQAAQGRVVAVYQHVRAKKTCVRVDDCLRALAKEGVDAAWCSYESATVAMLFLSMNAARPIAIEKGFYSLLGRHAEHRVRGGTT
jgi:hypothetical protein